LFEEGADTEASYVESIRHLFEEDADAKPEEQGAAGGAPIHRVYNWKGAFKAGLYLKIRSTGMDGERNKVGT
jgi:hypothetical protein